MTVLLTGQTPHPDPHSTVSKLKPLKDEPSLQLCMIKTKTEQYAADEQIFIAYQYNKDHLMPLKVCKKINQLG